LRGFVRVHALLLAVRVAACDPFCIRLSVEATACPAKRHRHRQRRASRSARPAGQRHSTL
jgi:hypothetical protein